MVIGIVMGIAFAACSPSVKVPEPEVAEQSRSIEGPSLELSAIDSLMWKQPDSALAQLQRFVASPAADSLDEFNGHYCQLLVSELLYKNDYIQSNRENLIQAVDYFDSLAMDTHGMYLYEQNVFLDARAHYINGVGYYEQKNMIQACSEYLKVLEVMEVNFQDQELTGIRAKFMFYTYNRLLELFSAQFMMASAIKCGEEALAYCQKEPSLSKEIPNTYFHIGKQYDKLGEKNIASEYYSWAIEGLSDINSLVYRDAVSMKALCDYQVGHEVDSSLTMIRQMITFANSEKEKLTRFMTMGVIFTVEQSFDSAVNYLKPVFENKDNASLQMQAAEHLLVNYDNLGNKEKSDECTRFLANYKKTEGENKAMVSKLEDLFKEYMDQKQQKEAEELREMSIKRTVGIIVPIAIVVAFSIIVLQKLKSKKLLKEQQEESNRELKDRDKRHAEAIEAERQAHRMEQAALSGRLKRSNEELRDISKRLELSLSKNAQYESGVSNDYAAFINDPICKHIVGVAHKQQFKSKTDYLIYKDNALSKEQLLDLRNAVQKHLPRFVSHIRRQYPKLTDNDMDCCCLVLLGLNEADISAMMQRAYTTVCDRSRKISRIIGTNDSLYHTLRNMLDE
ncbi:MAG: hypothetical protein IKW82_02525 [Bacteroidales bacterium]|nr:hypothetical protein [Bacteroidales bacterium]